MSSSRPSGPAAGQPPAAGASGAGVSVAGGLGGVVVVQGPEELRRVRAVARIVAEVRAVEPAAEIERLDGGSLGVGEIAGLVGASLFSPARVVVIDGADQLRPDVGDELVALTRDPEPQCALVLVHPGGNRPRATVDAVRRAGARFVACERAKQGELAGFAAAEAERSGHRLARGAAQALGDAVGGDLAAIAAAVAQLVEDLPESTRIIDVDHVATYYGGRADVSGFEIADELYNGRTTEALVRLRWALRANVAPVLLASALALGARSVLRYQGVAPRAGEAEVAAALGIPPWKVRSVRAQARGWTETAAGQALTVAAALDIAVKGGTTDPGFAVELAVLRIGALRDGS